MILAPRRCRCVLALALIGCASTAAAPPPPPSALVPAVDVDALVPPAPPSVQRPADERDPVPVDEGNACDLPPGVLVPDSAFARAIATKSERDRLAVESRVLRDLRAKERASALDVERFYQGRIAHLESELRSARAEWRPWVYVGVGILVTTIGAFAGARGAR